MQSVLNIFHFEMVHNTPFILDDLLEAVDHAGVVVLARYRDIALDLPVLVINPCPAHPWDAIALTLLSSPRLAGT